MFHSRRSLITAAAASCVTLAGRSLVIAEPVSQPFSDPLATELSQRGSTLPRDVLPAGWHGEYAVREALMAAARQLVPRIEALFAADAKQPLDVEDEARLCSAIRSLAYLRATDLTLLERHLDYRPKIHGSHHFREEPEWMEYPCLETLIRIGGRSLPMLAERLLNEDAPATLRLVRMGLLAVYKGTLQQSGTPGAIEANAVRLARCYLDTLPVEQLTEKCRKRLIREKELFKEAHENPRVLFGGKELHDRWDER